MATNRNLDRILAKIAKHATITHTAEEEHLPIADDFSDPQDAEHAKELARSSVWGWCCVRTEIEYLGFKTCVYLGACSYESSEAFAQDNGENQAYEACLALWQLLADTAHRGRAASNLMRSLQSRR